MELRKIAKILYLLALFLPFWERVKLTVLLIQYRLGIIDCKELRNHYPSYETGFGGGGFMRFIPVKTSGSNWL
ncbi:MAG: hypothetical protein ABGX12_06055 [Desulfurobacteriaceae bacterium]